MALRAPPPIGAVAATLAVNPVESRPSEARGSAEVPSPVTPYPEGSWRKLPPSELAKQLFWVSHILIRHEGVEPRVMSFERELWTAAPPPPARTREQALELARRIAREAREAPGRFAELARQNSEDIATRDVGGSLGPRSALQLAPWRSALDAIATLGAGDVSDVVETRFGFHVFLRRPPPVERELSGSRIIIGHDDAPWLARFLALKPPPPRTRAEALALAESIYRQVRADSSRFAEFAREYSEHRDALRGGDFGVWSTREKTPFPHAVEALQHLEVNEVAAPVDSLFGYQIIQRTENRARIRFAMSRMSIAFDASLPDADSHSRASVRRRASALARDLAKDPSSFESLRTEVETWVEGRKNVRMEQALSRVQPGQVVPEPIEEVRGFSILKRLEPAAGAAEQSTSSEQSAP